MRALLIIVAVLALCSSGCGLLMAQTDVDLAIAEAATVNLRNVEMAAAGRLAVHDRGLTKLELALDAKITASTGGEDAMKILTTYRIKREELTAARALDQGRYSKALDNAVLLTSLIGRRISLRAKWDAILGRIPGVSQIKLLAEAEARKYVDNLNRGLPVAGVEP